ncbi:peptidase M24, structural domain-containing protein [Zychaea mexicana]|uniref:peptidase M24, structural domain-containing protein n=1 Tax=Zychaea mexicana TaxID=64656 RepID=UPI0022FEBD6F|nr:peptidase M24, structural domain-containing protein [Zychaea mexicana]KAI9479487.1 peptidase M24, structural domain-containing protein [Zychaea mexicana]
MVLPTRQNVQKVLQHFDRKDGVIVVKGKVLEERDDTDVEVDFRQESSFYYLTGVAEPGFYVAIDVATQRIQLFAPPVNPDDVIWMGLPDSLETLQAKYDVDEALYTTDLDARLKAASAVYTIPQFKLSFDAPVKMASEEDNKALYAAIAEARCVKADWEIEAIRKSNKISSDAHVKVMEAVKAGMNESELYSAFLNESIRQGAFNQSYLPIFGAGKNAATLHYNKNNATIENATDLILVDAGAEYNYYTSDITRTFPAGGKFTDEAATIYSVVLDMQKACFAKLKAGAVWEDIHTVALEVACEGLVKAGILIGDKQELLDKDVVAAFFPHGIGHMLGIDVHDVAAYCTSGERINRPSYRYLRMRRTLAAGNVVTVEPGVYFCDFIIDPVVKAPETSKYINVEMLNKYKSVGGVRIEDNVVVTEEGYYNLTTAPKEIAEIEALMAEASSKKRKLE